MIPYVLPYKTPSGSIVPNQYDIVTDNGTYFQSYKTIVALKKGPIVAINPAAPLTRTTLRYLAKFLYEPPAGLTRRIHENLASGTWIPLNIP